MIVINFLTGKEYTLWIGCSRFGGGSDWGRLFNRID